MSASTCQRCGRTHRDLEHTCDDVAELEAISSRLVELEAKVDQVLELLQSLASGGPCREADPSATWSCVRPVGHGGQHVNEKGVAW